MKSRLLACSFTIAFLLPALAHAHPGHDGDHELVWEFSHLASEPLATLQCLALAGAGSWLIWRLLRSALTEKKQRVRNGFRR